MLDIPSVNAVVRRLRSSPATPAEARRPPADGGIPKEPGLYAWWMRPDQVPEVRGPRHPRELLELLYVGIAPKDAASRARLRSRICGQHLGGNTGSSTFRLALAALLSEREHWQLQAGRDRPLLLPDHNQELSRWQETNLCLCWAKHERPWEVEEQVIGAMQPPLNQAGNSGHELYGVVRAARQRLRECARP